MSEWVATIGLETHVQLNTKTKIWCSCPNDYGVSPNTHVCPVCLGYPGAMPVLNHEAVRKTVMSGLLLNCKIGMRSKHDRKSYFYPDMPKNYQITQYDQPLCIGGHVSIEVDGVVRDVQLNRIHLEEDVGKNTHLASSSGVDFNRAGTPLMEIVTEADMHNADEALAYVVALKQILEYGGVSDCNLEEGNVRCDVNTSVAKKGATELGVKTEIKNMNTFKGIHRALSYEIQRQIKVLEAGGEIIQETRRWDDEAEVTQSMRTKEYAHDYRYFPDPDLMPIVLTQEQVDVWGAELPELPQARKARFEADLGLPAYDAEVLVADKEIADFFEGVVKVCGNAKAASNWVMGEVLRALSEGEKTLSDAAITVEGLGGLIELVDKKVLNGPKAKEVFAILFEEGGEAQAIVDAKGLAQVSDSGAIDAFVDQAIAENPGPVADFQGGKEAALQFLVGQVMRFSRGKANPQMAGEAIKAKLLG